MICRRQIYHDLSHMCHIIRRPARVSCPRWPVRHRIGAARLKPHLDPEEREGARAGLGRRNVGQGKHHVTPGLGLPEGVHDVTLALAHLQIVDTHTAKDKNVSTRNVGKKDNCIFLLPVRQYLAKQHTQRRRVQGGWW